jgi:hypothetical protein
MSVLGSSNNDLCDNLKFKVRNQCIDLKLVGSKKIPDSLVSELDPEIYERTGHTS